MLQDASLMQLIGGGIIVVALALLVLEAQAPGGGIFGISGAACLVIGTLLASDRDIAATAGAGVLSLVCAGLTLKSAREARRARKYDSPTHPRSIAGQVGTATTALTPRGSVLIGGEQWTAETYDGEHIAQGEPVVAAEVSGLTIKVFRADESRRTGANSDDSIH